MSKTPSVIDLYRGVLDQTPSEVVTNETVLGPAAMAELLAARDELPALARAPEPGEIWPLLSHHTYANRSLFGTDNITVLPRALTLLLIHDGLVVADPLETVQQLIGQRTELEALAALNHATAALARVEALLDAGTLRLTRLRPALNEANRAATLEALGLSADLRVFTDLAEAGVSVLALPPNSQRNYLNQVRELYSRFGLTVPPPPSVEAALAAVKHLAAAVIEVTWQFSVVATDNTCDLAVRGSLEQHLAEAVITQGIGGDLGPGRHINRLHLGHVPHLDPRQLTLANAIAIRSDDTFAGFRATTRQALDRLETDERFGIETYRTVSSFEETMQEGARVLRDQAKRTRFSDRVTEVFLPLALGTVADVAIAPLGGHLQAGVAGGAVSIATVLSQWLFSRGNNNPGHPAALRYFSMLGNVNNWKPAPELGTVFP